MDDLYERRTHRPISRSAFLWRLARHIGYSTISVLATLVAGMVGYHVTERLSWLDAFLNAAMLLGGMGPVDAPQTDAGKLFAGSYALFCGMIVILITGVIIAPIVHRVMHRFHWVEEK